MFNTHHENIDADARDLVRAFRENGSVSHHLLTIEQARDSYAKVCETNAVPLETMEAVDDLTLGDSDVPVRRYRANARSEIKAGVVFIHGGGWVMGSVDTHDALCRYIAKHADVTVLSIGYRLAPEHTYPAAADDCLAVLRSVVNNGHDLGIDTKRIIVAGDSAGGQLAAATVTSFVNQNPHHALAGQVLVYPATDLTMKGRSYQTVAGFPLVGDTMRWFIDQYVPDSRIRGSEDLSPGLHSIPENYPPTFLVTVENDPLRSEGEAYAAALSAAGALSRHQHILGQHHGLVTNAGVIPTGRKLLDEIVDFIRERAATCTDRTRSDGATS